MSIWRALSTRRGLEKVLDSDFQRAQCLKPETSGGEYYPPPLVLAFGTLHQYGGRLSKFHDACDSGRKDH